MRKPKRPRDTNLLAKKIVDLSTGEAEEENFKMSHYQNQTKVFNNGSNMRKSIQVHPSKIIQDELDARSWSLDDLASKMNGDFGINRLALDLYFIAGPENPGIRIGDAAEDLASIFEVSPMFFTNLENNYLESISIPVVASNLQKPLT